MHITTTPDYNGWGVKKCNSYIAEATINKSPRNYSNENNTLKDQIWDKRKGKLCLFNDPSASSRVRFPNHRTWKKLFRFPGNIMVPVIRSYPGDARYYDFGKLSFYPNSEGTLRLYALFMLEENHKENNYSEIMNFRTPLIKKLKANSLSGRTEILRHKNNESTKVYSAFKRFLTLASA